MTWVQNYITRYMQKYYKPMVPKPPVTKTAFPQYAPVRMKCPKCNK